MARHGTRARQTDPVDDEHDADAQVDALACSARGCRAGATWGLLWNNPRIHTPDRRKVWLACDAHREHLEHFLGARGFHRDTVAVDGLAAALAGRPDADDDAEP